MAIRDAGLLGQYRCDSGWDEWADDPSHRNEHWRMDGIFVFARQIIDSMQKEVNKSDVHKVIVLPIVINSLDQYRAIRCFNALQDKLCYCLQGLHI